MTTLFRVMTAVQLFLVCAGDVLAAAAEGGGGAAPAGKPASPGFGMFLPFLIIFGIFYFLVIAPQRKQQKETEKMQSGLKKGDKIVTTSGMHGTIYDIKEAEKVVVVEVAPNVRLHFNRNSISAVRNLSTPQPVAK